MLKDLLLRSWRKKDFSRELARLR